MKILLFTLCLCFISIFIKGQIIYRESFSRTKYICENAILAFLQGIINYKYENFNSDLQILDIIPNFYNRKSINSIQYLNSHEIQINFPNDSFCIEYSALAMKNSIIIPISSQIKFSICVNLDILLKLPEKSNQNPFENIIMNAKIRLENFYIENWVKKMFGFENLLKKSLELWIEKFSQIIEEVWKNTGINRYQIYYQKFDFGICYTKFCQNLLLNYTKNYINNDLLIFEYGHENSDILQNSFNYSKQYILSPKIFSLLFQNIFLRKDLSFLFSQSNFSKNSQFWMDTNTFSQVIPDISLEFPNQFLIAKIFTKESIISSEIINNHIIIKNLTFGFSLNNTILEGIFNINLEISLFLNYADNSVKIISNLEKFSIFVQFLKSTKYITLLKSGMENIIFTAINELLKEKFFENLLGSGIFISNFPEKINIEKSNIFIDKNQQIYINLIHNE